MPTMLMSPASGATLTPRQMWDRLSVERGFLSSSGGPRDAYRTQGPTALTAEQLGSNGAPVGKGYETLAIIQILDKDGRTVGPLGLGFFETGGPDEHAEATVLKQLKAVPEMRKGKMVVVVETTICPSCISKLVGWAKQAHLAAIDTYLPERQSMTSDVMVRPKTAARTAMMGGRPALQLKFQGLEVSR